MLAITLFAYYIRHTAMIFCHAAYYYDVVVAICYATTLIFRLITILPLWRHADADTLCLIYYMFHIRAILRFYC